MNHSNYNSKPDPKQPKSTVAPIVTPTPDEKGKAVPQSPTTPVKAEATGNTSADAAMVKQGDEHDAAKLVPVEDDEVETPIVEKTAATETLHAATPQTPAPTISAKPAI